jgi:hypothetical protein
MGLGIPIQQGQTRYQYLVMQFTREEETTAELNITECVLHSPLSILRCYNSVLAGRRLPLMTG